MKKNGICDAVKKYCMKFLSVGLVFSMAAGWWGFLYPQLALNRDTCRVVTRDGEEFSGDREQEEDSNLYLEILDADRGRIRFRFRFVEEIRKYLDRVCGS